MRRILIMVAILALSKAAFAATPTISNVGGTVASGQTLTIAGTNMVQENKSNWDSFFTKYPNAYGFEGASKTSDGYTAMGPSGGTYVSDVKLMGNKSFKFHTQGAWPAGPGGLGDYVAVNPSVGDVGELWVRFYAKWNLVSGKWPTNFFKIMDTQGSSGTTQHYFTFPGIASGQPTHFNAKYDGSNHDSAIPGGPLVNNRWYLIELRFKSSSPRNYTAWVDGQQIHNGTPTSNTTVNYLLFGGPINLAGTDSNFSLDSWFDGLTFGYQRINPASMIEVSGDGKTWKYQEPLYLSDTSSQIKLNLSGLTGTDYQIRVKNNQLQTSNIYKLNNGGSVGDTQAPTTPSGVAASVFSSSQINVSWVASTDNVGVVGYKIYRNGTYLATSTTTSFVNTGLAASTSYSYSISAIDAAGNESAQSTATNATTQAASSGGDATGMTLFKESFDNGSFAARGWYDNTTHGTIATGGQSGSALQWAWAQGAQKPTNGGSMRKKITPTDSLYMSFYVKFQTGWRGSQVAYHPHMFLIPSDLDSDYTPLANNYLNTYIEYVSDIGGSYAIRPRMAIQDQMRVNTANGTPPNNLTAITENRSVAYCNTPVPAGMIGECFAATPYYSNNSVKSSSSLSTNVWHKVEVYLKMNTISGGKGQSNGIMQQWLDGNLVINRSDVLYRTAQDATKKWAQFVLAPYIGTGSPIAQTMWVDELTVATAPPATSGGDVLPPTTPSGLAATAASSSQINLSWTASTDNTAVTGYKIYRNGTSVATATTTSYTDTGLTASTSYSYKVSAIDAAGNESAQSVAATATTKAAADTTAPSAPAGLTASAVSSSSVNLSWTASTDNVGVTGYKVYRNGALVTTTATTMYADSGLSASTSYSYKVSAIDAAGNESGQSVTASATTQEPPDTTAPSTPSGVTASAVSSSSINLAWTASTDNLGVAAYKIYRGGTNIATSRTTSYTDSGLTAATAYTYKVSAVDAAGNESVQSVAASATTQPAVVIDTTAPSIPSGLTAGATSSTQVSLSWTASTDNIGVTGYKVYRNGILAATATTTTYADSGLTATTAYSYKVSAIDAAGNESAQSTAASATTQAASAATLLHESFENSSFASRGWYDNTTHGTVVAGGQSGNSLQWAWTKGATQPANGAAMRKIFAPTDSLYVSFYVKFQSGWQGTQKANMIQIPSDLDSHWTSLADNYLINYIEFSSDIGSPYAIRPQLAIQDQKRVNTANGTPPNNLTAVTEERSVAYCNTPVPAGVTGTCSAANPYYSLNLWKAPTATVSTNAWHRVEVYFKMNTISGGKGQANGVMQQWIDGAQVINRNDVLYRTAQDATKKWAQFVLAPYIGGGSPIAQSMWLDELTVSTTPPRVPLSAPTGFKVMSK